MSYYRHDICWCDVLGFAGYNIYIIILCLVCPKVAQAILNVRVIRLNLAAVNTKTVSKYKSGFPAKFSIKSLYLAFTRPPRAFSQYNASGDRKKNRGGVGDGNVISYYENINRIVFIQFTDRIQLVYNIIIMYIGTSIFHII